MQNWYACTGQCPEYQLQNFQVTVKATAAKPGIIDTVGKDFFVVSFPFSLIECVAPALVLLVFLFMDHRINSLEITQAALLASLGSAIRSIHSFQRIVQFSNQKVPVNS